jgi:hypothetical protein
MADLVQGDEIGDLSADRRDPDRKRPAPVPPVHLGPAARARQADDPVLRAQLVDVPVEQLG